MAKSELCEFRLGHPGALATTELATIIRVANRARSQKSQLVACSTSGWVVPHYQDFNQPEYHVQSGGSPHMIAPIYRGFVHLPRYTTSVRVLSTMLLPICDYVLAHPRACVKVGSDRDVVYTRAIACSEMSVSGTTATFTLEEGHNVRIGQAIYTEDFTANIAETSPGVVITSEPTYVVAELTASMTSGSKGAGTLRAPADLTIDTAANADDGTRLGPIAASPWNVFTSSMHLPTMLEQRVDLENVDTTSASTVAEVIVDLRCRTANVIIKGNVPYQQAAGVYIPLLTMVWAEVDEDSLSPSPLELSAGDKVTSTLLTTMNDAVAEASLKPTTHVALHCGAAGWDDYAGAPGLGGLVRDVNCTTTTTVHDVDVYLDEYCTLNVGILHTLGSGTWNANVYSDGVLVASSGTLSTASSAEVVLTTSTLLAGWRHLKVEYAGSGAIYPRAVRVTENTSLATPAND